MPRRPLRIALVAPTLQILGGHAVQASRLLQTWRFDRDIDVRLIPINPAPPRSLAPLSKMKYVRTAVTQLCYWPSLLRELHKVDVVHVFSPSNPSFFRSCVPAVVVAWLYRKPVVVNYRGDGRDHLAGSAAARRILRSVDVIVVPSAYFHAIFAEFGIRSRIVPNIADLSQFRYRMRESMGLQLLSTRNFEPIYNVACTLRAFARVQRRYPDATLVLVGGGREESILRRLAQQLGLRGVTFAGSVSPSAISAFYDTADVYVQTPIVDNMPGSMIEAFASGLPVVATRVGGVPAIIEHGIHGLLASPDDDEEVAGHIMHLFDNPLDARRMAAAAAASCQAYDAAVIREKWRDVYDALADTWTAAVIESAG